MIGQVYKDGHPSAHRQNAADYRRAKQLMQSTLELVLEKLRRHSIQDITDGQTSAGTFYIHFKDKEEVVWTAFRDLFQSWSKKRTNNSTAHATGGILWTSEYLPPRRRKTAISTG